MRKRINRLWYVILNLLIMYGIIAPYLISARNNELVITGIGISLLNLYHLVVFLINTLKLKKNESK